ncbi:hypothetical protein H6P81_016059 [Aristolochia fimbriata]|uniref:Uncharacterized protein n=1 Tax=Aristolochia fimbriata TaxID=158543 RepID=A0AAV7E7X3_ARIFI|nr:hypothetical protein H6P81_016059 [Aristolochia fimbriata]
MGSPLAGAKSAQVPREGTSVRSQPTLLVHPEAMYPRRDHPPRAWVARDPASVDASREGRPDRPSPPSRASTGARIAGPHPLPSRQFQALFDSLFKVLFIFPSRYLFAIGLSPLFSLGRRIYRPIWAAFPNNPTSPTTPRGRQVRAQRGCHPLWRPIPWDLRPSVAKGTLLRTTIERRKPLGSHTGLFPFARPLLGESFGCSHLTWGRNPSKASGSTEATARQGSSSEPGPRTRLEPATQGGEGGATTVRPACPWGKVFFSQPRPGGKGDQSAAPDDHRDRQPGGAAGHGWGEHAGRDAQVTVFEVGRQGHAQLGTASRFLFKQAQIAPVVVRVFAPDRRGRPTLSPSAPGRERWYEGFDGRFAPGRPPVAAGHRVQLVRLGRSRFVESTMILPQVQWTSRNVIGGEPPTSPRSEHFTGPFNRQIAPPTKNGHAPPPIESRKSSRLSILTMSGPGAGGVLKATSADPWSASFMVETRTLELPRLLAPDLPSNGSSLRDLDCTHSNYQTREPGIVIYCHYLPVVDWVICACRCCLSLDVVAAVEAPSPESNPNSPSPANTMVGPYPTIES